MGHQYSVYVVTVDRKGRQRRYWVASTERELSHLGWMGLRDLLVEWAYKAHFLIGRKTHLTLEVDVHQIRHPSSRQAKALFEVELNPRTLDAEFKFANLPYEWQSARAEYYWWEKRSRNPEPFIYPKGEFDPEKAEVGFSRRSNYTPYGHRLYRKHPLTPTHSNYLKPRD